MLRFSPGSHFRECLFVPDIPVNQSRDCVALERKERGSRVDVGLLAFFLINLFFLVLSCGKIKQNSWVLCNCCASHFC